MGITRVWINPEEGNIVSEWDGEGEGFLWHRGDFTTVLDDFDPALPEWQQIYQTGGVIGRDPVSAVDPEENRQP